MVDRSFRDVTGPLPTHLWPKLVAATLRDALPAVAWLHEHDVSLAECVVCGSLTPHTWACVEPDDCWHSINRGEALPERPLRYSV